MMITILLLSSFQECYHNSNTHHPFQENIIENNCNFNIIRINKKDLLCSDYGINKKYCNHYLLPYEFIISKEIGVNNKENIIIKPYAMWETNQINYNIKLADFYYTFTCSKDDNFPKLILNIVPKKEFDNSIYEGIFYLLIKIIIIFISSLLFNYFNLFNSDIIWLCYIFLIKIYVYVQ